MRDEATADEIVERIAELPPTAKTAVDQRALDLLELLVERRAAELQNQPGPHADKALAALRRGVQARVVARRAAARWPTSSPASAASRSRRSPRSNSANWTCCTAVPRPRHVRPAAHRQRYAETCSTATRAAPEATDLLQAALKEFEDANNGVLPTSANNALTTLIAFTEAAGHYERGEKLLLAQLKHPVHAEQKDWLIRAAERTVPPGAVRTRARCRSARARLYKALEKQAARRAARDRSEPSLPAARPTRRASTARPTTSRSPGVADDLKTFAFKLLPPILKEQINNYEAIVRDVADTLAPGGRSARRHRLPAGPHRERAGLAALHATRTAGASTATGSANGAREVKDLGDLEPRLLKFVLAELRRDLRTRKSRDRDHLRPPAQLLLAEKEADFAKVAEEVLAERKQSSAAVEYIAEYMFCGLPRPRSGPSKSSSRPTSEKLLAESGQGAARRLSAPRSALRRVDRAACCRSSSCGRRTSTTARELMHAYFRTGKQAELLALLKQTDAYFHEKDRWNEGVLAGLGAQLPGRTTSTRSRSPTTRN